MSADFHIFRIKDDRFIFHPLSLQFYKLERDSDIDTVCNEYLNGKDLLENERLIKKCIKKFLINNSQQNPILKKTYKKIANIEFKLVILPIAGDCNLKCSYCFANTGKGFGFGSYDYAQAKNIIDFVLSNNTQDICCMSFFGGEPLLKFNIMKKIVSYIKENYGQKKVSFSLTTNGTILNEEIIDFIKSENISVLVSIDGPKDASKHRIFKTGKSSYDIVFNNILQLKKEDIKLQLRSTISSDCEDLVSIYDFFESLKIPFAAVRAYNAVNNTNLANYKNENEKFEILYQKLFEYYSNKILEKEQIYCISIMSDINRIENKERRAFSCSSGINFFAITNTGDIFTCEHFAFDSQLAVGNINYGINKSRLRRMTPQHVDNIKMCKECWIKYLCSGGCFSSMKLSEGEVINFEDECKLKRIYWEFILKLYYKLKTNINTSKI